MSRVSRNLADDLWPIMGSGPDSLEVGGFRGGPQWSDGVTALHECRELLWRAALWPLNCAGVDRDTRRCVALSAEISTPVLTRSTIEKSAVPQRESNSRPIPLKRRGSR